MRAPGFLTARIRGFRIVNLLALTALLVIALASYALKTLAGAQDAGGVDVETQIVQEQKRIRMLQAEISTLGGPQRVADLSRQYLNLGPPDAKHDITEDALPTMVAQIRNPSPVKGKPDPHAATPVPVDATVAPAIIAHSTVPDAILPGRTIPGATIR